MQYLKEMPNGNRKQVDQEQFLVDKHNPDYCQIIATSALVIYKLARRATGHVPKPLRYGGRGRGGPGTVWNGA